MVSLNDYRKLLEERPRKFTAEEVEYNKDAEGKNEICFKCLHYFRRTIDDFGVCEIFRSEETDVDGVKPDATCRFFTHDGKLFPLYKATDEPS
jgi:hypothetical protein